MQVVLLAMPGHKGACAIDDTGRKALAVLRALGLPTCLGLSCGPETGSLQDRAAARKAAAAALEQEVCIMMYIGPAWHSSIPKIGALF